MTEMYKPFKVIQTREHPDGSLGVFYEVWKVTALTPGRSRTERLESYITVPQGADTDTYLFEQLSKAGWF